MDFGLGKFVELIAEWFGKPVARFFAVIVMIGVSAFLINTTWNSLIMPLYQFFQEFKKEYFLQILDDLEVLSITALAVFGLFGLIGGLWLYVAAFLTQRKLRKYDDYVEVMSNTLDSIDQNPEMNVEQFMEILKKHQKDKRNLAD